MPNKIHLQTQIWPKSATSLKISECHLITILVSRLKALGAATVHILFIIINPILRTLKCPLLSDQCISVCAFRFFLMLFFSVKHSVPFYPLGKAQPSFKCPYIPQLKHIVLQLVDYVFCLTLLPQIQKFKKAATLSHLKNSQYHAVPDIYQVKVCGLAIAF